MRAQTLAATNRALRPIVAQALAAFVKRGCAEPFDGAIDGAIDGAQVRVTIETPDRGGVFLVARDPETGGHFGTWQVALRAI